MSESEGRIVTLTFDTERCKAPEVELIGVMLEGQIPVHWPAATPVPQAVAPVTGSPKKRPRHPSQQQVRARKIRMALKTLPARPSIDDYGKLAHKLRVSLPPSIRNDLRAPRPASYIEAVTHPRFRKARHRIGTELSQLWQSRSKV